MDPETLDALLNILTKLGPWGSISLLGLSILVWVWKHPIRPIARSVAEIKDNHLHELPELVENSRRTVDTLHRIEVKLVENLTAINAKLGEK